MDSFTVQTNSKESVCNQHNLHGFIRISFLETMVKNYTEERSCNALQKIWFDHVTNFVSRQHWWNKLVDRNLEPSALLDIYIYVETNFHCYNLQWKMNYMVLEFLIHLVMEERRRLQSGSLKVPLSSWLVTCYHGYGTCSSFEFTCIKACRFKIT